MAVRHSQSTRGRHQGAQGVHLGSVNTWRQGRTYCAEVRFLNGHKEKDWFTLFASALRFASLCCTTCCSEKLPIFGLPPFLDKKPFAAETTLKGLTTVAGFPHRICVKRRMIAG